MSRPVRLRAACNSCHAAKVKCSGQKTGCDRCTDLRQHCKYEISMVGKVAGQRCRGRKRSLQTDHLVDGTANRIITTLSASSAQTPSPPSSNEHTVVVMTQGSPDLHGSSSKSQIQDQGSTENYSNLPKTPSSYPSREDEGYFDLLPDAEFNFMQLPDVDVNGGEATRPLEDNNIVGAGSGMSESIQEWYTSARSAGGLHPAQCETFDGVQLGSSIPSWITTQTIAHGPLCNSTVTASTVLTPSDSLPQPDHTDNTTHAVHALSCLDSGDNHGEEVGHTTGCGEIVRTLVIKRTAKMGSLDLILRDCKKYVLRLEGIVRNDEFEQSPASRSMVCTALNLIIDQLERCIVVDTPEQPGDVAAHFLSPASSCPGTNAPSESRFLQQTVHFRCPIPSMDFGALRYDGKEQLGFCKYFLQIEADRALRLVRLLQQKQAGNGKCQASISAAKIQEFWCQEFIARLQSLLRPLAVEGKAKRSDTFI